MMTQAEVYRLFGEIDRTPGIMEPRLGRGGELGQWPKSPSFGS